MMSTGKLHAGLKGRQSDEVVKTFISDPRVIEAAACLPPPIELVRFFLTRLWADIGRPKLMKSFILPKYELKSTSSGVH